MKINRIHIKNRRGEQHHQGCGKTVHHPVCLKPAAFKAGKRTWHTSVSPFPHQLAPDRSRRNLY